MAIEATKDSLCINQIVDQKKDTFTVEEDFIVPDVKPDILNTINTTAIALPNSGLWTRSPTNCSERRIGNNETLFIKRA